MVDRPVPSHAAAAQAVVSPSGVLAHGYVSNARYGDGTRWIEVLLVVPDGPAVSSGPVSAALDMARPWAVLTEVSVETGAHVCARAQNVTAFDPGRLTPAAGGGDAWRGTYVEIACDDGAGFAFYRVQWDAGADWMVRHPLPLAYSGGRIDRWSAPPMYGAVETVPEAVQQSTLSVCGLRGGQQAPNPEECVSGYGTVVPETARITAQVASTASS